MNGIFLIQKVIFIIHTHLLSELFKVVNICLNFFTIAFMQWFTEFMELFFISMRLIKTLKFILSVFLGTTKASQQVPVSVSDPPDLEDDKEVCPHHTSSVHPAGTTPVLSERTFATEDVSLSLMPPRSQGVPT